MKKSAVINIKKEHSHVLKGWIDFDDIKDHLLRETIMDCQTRKKALAKLNCDVKRVLGVLEK